MADLFIKVGYFIPRNNIRDFVVVRYRGQSDNEILTEALRQLIDLGWNNPQQVSILGRG